MSKFPIPQSAELFECIYDLDKTFAEWGAEITELLGASMDGGHGAMSVILSSELIECPMFGAYELDRGVEAMARYNYALLEENDGAPNFDTLFGRPVNHIAPGAGLSPFYLWIPGAWIPGASTELIRGVI